MGTLAVDRPSTFSDPPPSPELLMEARDVSCWYGSNCAVKGISVEIHRGEILALIGPSGCGKTTFLRSLNRLLDLVPGARVEGSITLKGTDVRSAAMDPETLRRRVGYVFQLPNPFPMSIYENLALALLEHRVVQSRDECRAVVVDVLERVGLLRETEGDLDRSALSLSGGQQQRLCIARLLTLKPEVVLLDEPCSALDPRSTWTIERELVDLKRDYGIVIVTHNLAQARRIADRVGFFLNGELIEISPTSSVFEEADDVRTRDYIAGRFG